MEAQIREDSVLEFKALTMSKRIFEQLRQVKPDEVEGEGAYEAKFIGWVHDGHCEYFIGKAHGTLVRVPRMDMWEWMVAWLGGHEQFKAEAQKLNTGSAQYMNIKLDEYRNSVPQIFLK